MTAQQFVEKILKDNPEGVLVPTIVHFGKMKGIPETGITEILEYWLELGELVIDEDSRVSFG